MGRKGIGIFKRHGRGHAYTHGPGGRRLMDMAILTSRIRGGDGNIITDSETKCNVSTGPDPRYRLGMFGTDLDSTPEYGILSTTTSVPRSTICL